jgi:two-component system cell cycle sensor histidine kinase/response regulator CckA
MIEALGYKILKTASGDEACERYNGKVDRIDLLLTDIVMPGIDGATVAARFREQRAEMKVLFMSGYANNRVDGESVPNSSFLQKPYSIEEFGRRICGMLTAA